eukprot:CAMPEP_0198269906 /NCGR_PEP_ID=MMETSP1447-20131203/43092_1 /TAXON_ID=420782 /ORGANISM="Chaetoceros dichaeta, Strain CCMP1751" /LENGTH=280 /DNA_ID=CAMNT_0043961691 /DNA_START=236 /DNA_END=1078 /DNA_ORIENTATION=+
MSTTINPPAMCVEMKQNNKRCHRIRRVCFSTEADDICYLPNVPPASSMTNKERDSAWYTYEDMIHMKEEAKIIARRLREVANITTSRTPPLSNDDGTTPTRQNDLKRRLDEEFPLDFTTSSSAAIDEDSNETYRGLELRIFLGRQLKKYFAARKIIEYQRKYKLIIAVAMKNGDPNIGLLTEDLSKKLGYVSAKCSRWARDRALVTGHSDFEGVYPQSKNVLPISSFKQLTQFPHKRMRSNEFEINGSHKKMNYDSTKQKGGCVVPFDGIHHDILPVNIF